MKDFVKYCAWVLFIGGTIGTHEIVKMLQWFDPRSLDYDSVAMMVGLVCLCILYKD